MVDWLYKICSKKTKGERRYNLYHINNFNWTYVVVNAFRRHYENTVKQVECPLPFSQKMFVIVNINVHFLYPDIPSNTNIHVQVPVVQDNINVHLQDPVIPSIINVHFSVLDVSYNTNVPFPVPVIPSNIKVKVHFPVPDIPSNI